MRKTLLFSILFILSSLLLWSCTEHESFDTLIISDKNISKEDLILKFNKDGILQLDKAAENLLIRYINETLKFAGEQEKVESIHSSKVVVITDPNIEAKNLVFSVSDYLGAQYPIGILFVAHSSKNIETTFSSRDINKCTPNSCGCCDFIYNNTSNEIIGCMCNGGKQSESACPSNEGQFCNHTIMRVNH